MKKAQGAVEILIIAGVALVLIAVLYVNLQSNQSGAQGQADTEIARIALDDLDSAGASVYQQGIGAQSQASLTLPSGVAGVTFQGRSAKITFQNGDVTYRNLDYEALGSLAGTSEGIQVIPVTSTAQGVCFGDLSSCVLCGDGILDVDEQCDDDNTLNGDGCSSSCTLENLPTCGDGILNQAGEQCDDGNLVPGDGCSAACTIELGNPYCGDGSINQANETCDDGNHVNGDGCDSTCIEEVVAPVCGDGLENQVSEECDDGNNENYDGCNMNCLIEDDTSSITICLAVLDARGNFTGGATQPGITLHVDNDVEEGSSGGPATSVLPNTTFTTPFQLTHDSVGFDGIKDSKCNTYYGLVVGNFYYGRMNISGGQWKEPLYNDQYSQDALNSSYFFEYDDSLWDGNPSNDYYRDRNADGNIILVDDRSRRTAVVLARYPTVCGDSLVNQPNETCDDGNFANGDGCSSTCRLELCGNGVCDSSENENYATCASDCQQASSCVSISTGSHYLSNSNRRIRNIQVSNICANQDVRIVGGVAYWSSNEDLERIEFDGSHTWYYNCGSSCTPSGRQNSGAKVWFSTDNATKLTIAGSGSDILDQVRYDSSISGSAVKVGLLFDDGTQKNSSQFTAGS